MTLNLTLDPELERRLTEAAEQSGVSADQWTLQLLDRHLPPPNRQAAVVAAIQSWIDEADSTEQQETGDYLIRALDEDRSSDRKLFPPELEGISW